MCQENAWNIGHGWHNIWLRSCIFVKKRDSINKQSSLLKKNISSDTLLTGFQGFIGRIVKIKDPKEKISHIIILKFFLKL